jgi:hypothetical protein
MLKNTTNKLMLLLLLFSLIGPGCILNPTDEKIPPKVDDVYGDLTNKDHVIKNLVKSYNEANIDEYTKIIHDDYLFYNQAKDVAGGADPFVLRDADVAATSNLFQAKNGTYPNPDMLVDKLELKLYTGSWESITEFEGNPCEDCWQTTREYYITVQMNSGNTTYIGNDLVKLTVVPVMEGDKKLYKLRRMDDIQKGGS